MHSNSGIDSTKKQKLKVQEPKSCTSLKQERNMICSEGEISGLIELTEELETDLYSGCYSNTCTTHPYSPAPLPSSSYEPSSPFPSKKEQTKSNSSPLPKKQKNTSTLPTTKPMKPLTNKQIKRTPAENTHKTNTPHTDPQIEPHTNLHSAQVSPILNTKHAQEEPHTTQDASTLVTLNKKLSGTITPPTNQPLPELQDLLTNITPSSSSQFPTPPQNTLKEVQCFSTIISQANAAANTQNVSANVGQAWNSNSNNAYVPRSVLYSYGSNSYIKNRLSTIHSLGSVDREEESIISEADRENDDKYKDRRNLIHELNMFQTREDSKACAFNHTELATVCEKTKGKIQELKERIYQNRRERNPKIIEKEECLEDQEFSFETHEPDEVREIFEIVAIKMDIHKNGVLYLKRVVSVPNCLFLLG